MIFARYVHIRCSCLDSKQRQRSRPNRGSAGLCPWTVSWPGLTRPCPRHPCRPTACAAGRSALGAGWQPGVQCAVCTLLAPGYHPMMSRATPETPETLVGRIERDASNNIRCSMRRVSQLAQAPGEQARGGAPAVPRRVGLRLRGGGAAHPALAELGGEHGRVDCNAAEHTL